MNSNQSLIKDIGFDLIQNHLSENTKFTDNKILLKELHPMNSIKEIKESQNYTQEIINSLNRKEKFSIDNINNIEHIINSLSISNSILKKEDFQELKKIFQLSNTLRNKLSSDNFPKWKKLTKSLHDYSSILKKINTVFDNQFIIKISASKLLKKINLEKEQIDKNIIKTANIILKKTIKNKWNMGDKITWKNNRITIPINHSYKKKINGVIQDISNTGQTVFVEPIEIIELNNRYNELLYNEKIEISKILSDLTDKIRKVKNKIIDSYKIEKKYDYHFTISDFSQRINGIKPILNKTNYYDLKNVSNPIFKLKNKNYVNLNLELKNNVLLISGPNAGGKTVVLKTLGMICYMAQCGLFVNGDMIDVPFLDNLFSDIGDKQSIDNDLSTFSSHISNLNQIIKKSTKNTLILIDELGTGTDPDAGAAISIALINELISKDCKILATTHLGSLKVWAEKNKFTINAHMLFDNIKLIPTFKLEIGQPGASYAIEILKTLGINSKIVNKCKSLMKKDELLLEKTLIQLQNLHKEKIDLNEKLNEKLNFISVKEKEITDKEKIVDELFKKSKYEASKKAEEIIKSSRALIEKTIENIKSKKSSNNIIKEEKRKINSHLKNLTKFKYKEKINEHPLNTVKKDLIVYIPHLDIHGRIIDISKNKCLVMAGSIKLSIETKKLFKAKKDYELEINSTGNQPIINLTNESSNKIDLRGFRVNDAIEKIDKILDSSIINNFNSIHILHGKGTGALITGIHNYLKDQTIVKNFYFSKTEFGGTGITIVELK